METLRDPALEALTAALRAREVEGVEIAFVLGSGLGSFTGRLEGAARHPWDAIAALPQVQVAGHAGELVVGRLAGHRVLAQSGRVHLYEGRSAREVTLFVRAAAALGCRRFVLTNAAGAIRPEWAPGTLVRIVDHLDLQGRAPLDPAQAGCALPYDGQLGAALDAGARQAGVTLERGVYAGVLGPSYETPAEIRMLRSFGADLVGMSTVGEVLAARAAGARVAALSLVANRAAGVGAGRASHAEVLRAGEEAAERVGAVLAAGVPHLASVGEAGG